MLRRVLILSLGVVIFSFGIPSFSHEETKEEMEWVWGEVISLNIEKNEIKVKYLDPEEDIEKEITITSDQDTKFENVSSISEIKIGDSISCDYIVKEGKNVAKFISIERAETPTEP